MPESEGGYESSKKRDSQWYVLRRCLKLLACLERSPATLAELLKAVSEEEALEDSAARRRLEEDRRRLRSILGCDIHFDRATGRYHLQSVGFPVLDLPPDAVQGIAFLQATFGENAPMSREIHSLIDSLLLLLPEERAFEVAQARVLINVNLQPRDKDEIPVDVWRAVERAYISHRRLEFDYISPQHADGIPRRNIVEPEKYFFNASRAHYYLRAYCLEVIGPYGAWRRNEVVEYRLGRIKNLRVLQTTFTPRRPSTPKHVLSYELAPEIARLGVTEHFPGSEITLYSDGSALVNARVDNLFTALQTLLHYGPNCRVVGGPQAVESMRAIVSKMYAQYS